MNLGQFIDLFLALADGPHPPEVSPGDQVYHGKNSIEFDAHSTHGFLGECINR